MSKAREIKFRAWSDLERVMLDPFDVSEYPSDHAANLSLMQYTGLHDKNGKEIYEGDIVKYYDSYHMWLTGLVINNGIGFGISVEGDWLELTEFAGYPVYVENLPNVEEIEVIGNIYENPELLGGK